MFDELIADAVGSQSVAHASAFIDRERGRERVRQKLAGLQVEDGEKTEPVQRLLLDRLDEFDAGRPAKHHVCASLPSIASMLFTELSVPS